MGLGFVDLTVLMEEMGRAVMPGPYFSTVLLGGLALLEAGTEAQKKTWLPELASGDQRVTLAWMEPSAHSAPPGSRWRPSRPAAAHARRHQALRARRPHRRRHRGGGAHGLGPVPEDGVSLFLVPRATPGLEVKLLPTMDQTRKLCEVTLAGSRSARTRSWARPARGWAPLARVLDRACVALCAEMCGAPRRCST